MSAKTAETSFESWLAYMDAALAEFLALMPVGLKDRMDFSAASLDALEAWLLSRYPDVNSARAEAEAQVVGGAARYVGEVIRKATGSRWAIELRDRDFAYFGLPVLRDGKVGSLGECPRSMVMAALDRRAGAYLSRRASGLIER